MKNTRHYIFTLSFLLTITGLSANERLKNIAAIDTATISKQTSLIAVAVKDSIVNFGKLFLGARYKYGSNGTSSFDCSGFTSYVYNQFGYKLPRSSADQAKKFETIKKDDLQAGDLVFYQGRRQNGNVGHVGIVVETKENGEFKFIHASTSEGVVITNSESNYFTKRFVKASRVCGCDSVLFAMNASHTQAKHQSKNPQQSTAQETTQKTIAAKYHSVKKGENLSSIAREYGQTVSQLKTQNGLSKNTIGINQKLLIEKEKVILVAQNKIETNEKNVDKIKSTNDSILLAKNNTVKQHLVKSGETLHSIAKKHNVDIEQIKKLNKIANNKIAVGQNIQLTDSIRIDKSKEQSKKLAQNKTTNNDSLIAKGTQRNPIEIAKSTSNKNINNIEHQVHKGESLYSIARKYNCKPSDLKQWNNKTSDNLRIGEKLKIHTT